MRTWTVTVHDRIERHPHGPRLDIDDERRRRRRTSPLTGTDVSRPIGTLDRSTVA
jgi:hypothetical protein